MLRVLIRFFTLVLCFNLISCTQGGSGSSQVKVPSPGQDHVTQVYVVMDSQNLSGLSLSLLSNLSTAIPESKPYVYRPASIEEAKKVFFEISARQVDWLIVSGPMSKKVLEELSVSWSNSKRVLLLDDQFLNKSKFTNFYALVYDSQTFEKWQSEFCSKYKTEFSCPVGQSESIFAWPDQALEKSLVIVRWNWPAYLRSLSVGSDQRMHKVSFADGFLTLEVKLGAKVSNSDKAKLESWFKELALSGLMR